MTEPAALTVAIADDEPLARRRIRRLLEDQNQQEIVRGRPALRCLIYWILPPIPITRNFSRSSYTAATQIVAILPGVIPAHIQSVSIKRDRPGPREHHRKVSRRDTLLVLRRIVRDITDTQ